MEQDLYTDKQQDQWSTFPSKSRDAITYNKYDSISMNVLIFSFWITGGEFEARCRRVNKNQNHAN